MRGKGAESTSHAKNNGLLIKTSGRPSGTLLMKVSANRAGVSSHWSVFSELKDQLTIILAWPQPLCCQDLSTSFHRSHYHPSSSECVLTSQPAAEQTNQRENKRNKKRKMDKLFDFTLNRLLVDEKQTNEKTRVSYYTTRKRWDQKFHFWSNVPSFSMQSGPNHEDGRPRGL